MTRMTPPGTKNRAIYTNVRNRKVVLARSVALAALLAVSGCNSLSSQAQSETDPSVKLAAIFLNVGAPDAALRAANDALTRQPRNAVALKARADALAQTGQVEEAQLAYGALIAATPSDIAPRIALGRMLVQSNPAAAEQVFAEVLIRQPGNAIAMNNMGIARDLQGRHGEAQAAYRAARAVDPKMTGASVNLGLSQVLAGDMHEAVRTLTPLAALADAPATVHENLGIALAALGDTAEAKRVLGRVMSPAEVAEVLAQYRGASTPQSALIAPRRAAPMTISAPGAMTAVAEPMVPMAAPIAATPVMAPVALTPVAVPVAAVPIAAVPAAAEPDAEPVRLTGVPAAMPIAPGTPAAPFAAIPATQLRAAFAQLAASDSEAAAVGEWERLRRQIGTLLRDRPRITMAAEVAGRQVWRLRTGPFEQPREAEAFCAEVRAAGGKCWAAVGS